jgi:Flp pilus assembly protein TadG
MHREGPSRLVVPARRRGERGAVAVEFALVLPVLVMLLLGITTMGLVYSDHLSITNAVRESARLGSAVDYATSSNCPTCSPTAWADSVQTRVQQVYYNSGSTITSSQICVALVSAAGTSLATPTAQGTTCGTAPTPPTGLSTGTCIVEVWVRKPARVTLGILPDIAFNISAQSVSTYGRSTGSCTLS